MPWGLYAFNCNGIVVAEIRDVKVSRLAWSRDHFFGLGLGLGLIVIDLGLGLGLMR